MPALAQQSFEANFSVHTATPRVWQQTYRMILYRKTTERSLAQNLQGDAKAAAPRLHLSTRAASSPPASEMHAKTLLPYFCNASIPG